MDIVNTVVAALTIFQAILTLLPVLIKEFETPGVPGAQKKQAVMDVIKSLVDGLGTMGLKVPGTIILTLASIAIDGIVAGYNLVGVFKHGEKKQ